MSAPKTPSGLVDWWQGNN